LTSTDEQMFAYGAGMRFEPGELQHPERVEQLRRSVAMLPPSTAALKREEAETVLAALIEVLHEVRRLRPHE
jgi:hypothetical protein